MKMMNRRNFLGGALALPFFAPLIANASSANAKIIHKIDIRTFKFTPKEFEVKVGDIIRWTNLDIAPHTATAKDGSWDSGSLKKGEFFEIKVSANMHTNYYCKFHPHMVGSIVIVNR